MSPDTARIVYRLTGADCMSRYELACVCRALLNEAKGSDNEAAAVVRMAREIVADDDNDGRDA